VSFQTLTAPIAFFSKPAPDETALHHGPNHKPLPPLSLGLADQPTQSSGSAHEGRSSFTVTGAIRNIMPFYKNCVLVRLISRQA
jgi:hypothetical protein